MIYFDACYIAKYYLAETDSGVVSAKASQAGAVACSHYGKLEVASVFHRHLRENRITAGDYHLFRAQFDADCANGLWIWLPLDAALLEDGIRRYGILSPAAYLRAGDAIHLTCATVHGFSELYTSDPHLLEVAPHFDLTGIKL